MANTITQTCTHCGETKPLDSEHFHRNKGRTCGYLALCKPCQMKKVEKYNRENPQYWEAYRIKRGDYIRDYWEDYYELDTCKIYGIVCKETGETYVGFSQHKDINS